MSSTYQVIISDRARQMLGTHIRFLAQANKEAAKRVKQRLVDSISSLRHHPHRLPFFNAQFIPPNKYHKMYVENWYLVLYQIKDDTVYVDWIVDCRQNYTWLLH